MPSDGEVDGVALGVPSDGEDDGLVLGDEPVHVT